MFAFLHNPVRSVKTHTRTMTPQEQNVFRRALFLSMAGFHFMFSFYSCSWIVHDTLFDSLPVLTQTHVTRKPQPQPAPKCFTPSQFRRKFH